MNLGIYLSSLSNHDQLKDIADTINNNIGSKLTDASIFYDNVAYTPFKINCGLFNSTDLWNFNGKLITTSISTTLKALNIVNNIEIYYYYGWEDSVNALPLLNLANRGVKFIAKSDHKENELYRKTGKKPLTVSSNFSNIIDFIG